MKKKKCISRKYKKNSVLKIKLIIQLRTSKKKNKKKNKTLLHHYNLLLSIGA